MDVQYRYTLDGVAMPPEELACNSGLLAITAVNLAKTFKSTRCFDDIRAPVRFAGHQTSEDLMPRRDHSNQAQNSGVFNVLPKTDAI